MGRHDVVNIEIAGMLPGIPISKNPEILPFASSNIPAGQRPFSVPFSVGEILAGGEPLFPAVHEPDDPDARLVQKDDRGAEGEEGHRIRRGSDDGREDHDGHDRIGARSCEEVVIDDADEGQDDHDDGQLAEQSEADGQPDAERDVTLPRPQGFDAHLLIIVRKELERLRKDPMKSNESARGEQEKADKNAGEEELFLLSREGREDEGGEEINQKWQRDHDAAEKSQFNGGDETLGDFVCDELDVRRDRSPEKVGNIAHEKKRKRRGNRERDDDLQQGPSEILHVLEEGLDDIAIGLFAELKKLAQQGHGAGKMQQSMRGRKG